MHRCKKKGGKEHRCIFPSRKGCPKMEIKRRPCCSGNERREGDFIMSSVYDRRAESSDRFFFIIFRPSLLEMKTSPQARKAWDEEREQMRSEIANLTAQLEMVGDRKFIY